MNPEGERGTPSDALRIDRAKAGPCLRDDRANAEEGRRHVDLGVVTWERRRILHRYVYLVTLDRVGMAWTISAKGTADRRTSDSQ